MSAPAPGIGFEPVSAAHARLLARWLAEPHVSAWWGDPDKQLALVLGDIDEPLMDGYVFSIDGVPAGYTQSYPAAAWPGHPFGALADDSAMAVDIFLGEPGLLGRGIGSRALAAFAEALLAAGASRVLIDPDPDNERAIEAYGKAGFVLVGTGIGDDGPALIMVKERD